MLTLQEETDQVSLMQQDQIKQPIYNQFNDELRKAHNLEVQTAIFGADMKLSFTNDGPVTILMDSNNR
ncbi:MAG: D-tyrosyl-tRNA(Tyr) deacylase [Haloplasmataceae bacterium]|jgi:D-tyrosyl-tRNA(Tyr) deacylase|nr:D-tyrosyl-tRNA(Tyr) deacylase [Haloplasmataceae bacterium]